MQPRHEQPALRWVDRILQCLAAQSPLIEFVLAVAGVLLAGSASKPGGISQFVERAADAAVLLGILCALSVGCAPSRPSSV